MHATDKNILLSDYKENQIHKLPFSSPTVAIGGNSNYAHFIFEYMPKIIHAIESIGPDAIFIVNQCVEKWLKLATFICKHSTTMKPRFYVIDRNKVKKYKCENPYFIESSFGIGLKYYYSFDTFRQINHSVNVALSQADSASTSIKLYIARDVNQKSWRNLHNYKEVRSLCKKNGYKIVHMLKLSQLEQLKLLTNCNNLIVEGGADSFASLFCKPKTNVIELLPENFINGFGPVSSGVSLNQNYFRITGKLLITNKGATHIDHDYMIDTNYLDQLLKSLNPQTL